MSKILLAAGIVRDFEFDSLSAMDCYLTSLRQKKIHFRCLEQFNRSDGCIILRIVQQYNGSDLIEL